MMRCYWEESAFFFLVYTYSRLYPVTVSDHGQTFNTRIFILLLAMFLVSADFHNENADMFVSKMLVATYAGILFSITPRGLSDILP